jgi:hypothetical protein
MNKSNHEKSMAIGRQTTELMMATPQVVAHRLARLAMAGAMPSARDQREFHMMSAEKVAAFGESWNAIAIEVMKVQQQVALGVARAMWSPFGVGRGQPSLISMFTPSARSISTALGVIDKGMAPVHRRAVANAKRLRSTRIR